LRPAPPVYSIPFFFLESKESRQSRERKEKKKLLRLGHKEYSTCLGFYPYSLTAGYVMLENLPILHIFFAQFAITAAAGFSVPSSFGIPCCDVVCCLVVAEGVATPFLA
jgi:hypothetical protein